MRKSNMYHLDQMEKRGNRFTVDNGRCEISVEEFEETLSELVSYNAELQDAYLDTIHRLVIAAEYKDEDTDNHTTRVSCYSALIAEKIGLSGNIVHNIYHASPMHDIGKIGIPNSILLKPGKLSNAEFEIVKTHTTVGADILSDAKAEILQVAQLIAVSHHENWDGKGYPQGLIGDNIPLAGRIVKLADVFDVLTSMRPYKNPYPDDVACAMIRQEKGKHFDPLLVDIFIASIDEIFEIREEIGVVDSGYTSDFY